MTPGLSKNVWCQAWQFSFLCLQIIRPQVKRAINLVIADGHFNLSAGVCVLMYELTYSQDHYLGSQTEQGG